MEESKSSAPLLDLPKKLALQILNQCDYPSIQSLRKACRNLRDFIDEHNIKCPIPKAVIRFATDEISLTLCLNDNDSTYPEGGRLTIIYRKVATSLWYLWKKQTCMVSTERKDYAVKNKHTLTFFNDFDEILKQLGGPLENLEIILVDLKLLEKFQHYLRHQGTLIQTKTLKLQIFNSDIERILLAMDPEHLRSLEIALLDSAAGNNEIKSVFLGKYRRAEQWMRLKELRTEEIRVCLIGNLESIHHLSKVNTHLALVETEDIVAMKRSFLLSGPPKHWRITSRLIPSLEELAESLGQPYENEDDEGHCWFYRNAGARHILQILVSESLLELKFVETDEVPMNAIVQDQYYFYNPFF